MNAELTQETLAEQAGLSARAISDLERNVHRAPSRWTLERLSEALALPPDDYARLHAAASRRRGPSSLSVVGASKLPTPCTPLIGREEEHDTAVRLLREDAVRLLTLVGAGGIGKTRLAIQVAATVSTDFTDGVVFVPLAALRDYRLVIQSIASVLGVRAHAAYSTMDSIVAHLQDREVLLVIDNFEHLADAAPLISDILAGSAQLKVLVTSRSPLHLRGEHELEVGPLAVPNDLPTLEVRDLLHYPAVELFVQRAQAVKGGFALTEKNRSAVVNICRRLEGLPLALELAAARIKTVPPEALLSRLEGRLQFLIGGTRDVPERQHTMRSTIDWSYKLLKPEEQALFRSLSIFTGGFSTKAAMEVGAGTWTLSNDALDSLELLVDQSLLIVSEQEGGQPRFSMLETIREYGLERLTDTGDLPRAAQLHAHYFRLMGVRAEAELTGPAQQEWLNRLETEHDNLRAALQWFQELGLPELTLSLASSLHYFWFIRGYTGEGRDWLRQGLTGGSRIETGIQAKALRSAGFLAWVSGDSKEAAALLKHALDLSRHLDDKEGIAWSLLNLANVTAFVESRTALTQEALGLFRQIGNRRGIAWSLMHLGMPVTAQGDYQRAIPFLEEAVLLFEELSSKADLASARTSLAWAVLGNGSHDRATHLFTGALAVYEELGDKRGRGSSVYGLGWLALLRGEDAQASELMQQALIYWQEAAPGFTPYCLHGLACVAASVGRTERAARLFGAAASLCETLGATLSAFERAHGEQLLPVEYRQSGENVLTMGGDGGQAWTVRQAIAFALGNADA